MIGRVHLKTEQGTTSVQYFVIVSLKTIWKNNYIFMCCMFVGLCHIFCKAKGKREKTKQQQLQQKQKTKKTKKLKKQKTKNKKTKKQNNKKTKKQKTRLMKVTKGWVPWG